MKIEIAEPGRMTQTGSSLLKLIQNNNMPVLDLLVRESIQNSLDARLSNAKYVDLEYTTGAFNCESLSQELEGIHDALMHRFPEKEYEYIAIRDSNTTGLTGEMDYKKIKDNNYGNLLKLVYEICKPQEAEGAGGSWGLGKTVYFRIGIGLVVYYSRILLQDGTYQTRLAASYVEDETSQNAMIPIYNDQAKRGIAWWGEAVGENITQPITDDAYIDKFLSIFGVKTYTGTETGTTIIIPFISSEHLLKNNQVEYLNSREQAIVPFWCHKIEDYLSIAVQRWYAPRLSNPNFTNGAYLRLKINGRGIGADDMEPVFKVIQALYNRANFVKEDDVLTTDEAVTKVESIRVIKYLTDTNCGTVAFTKVSRELLGIQAPQNKPEPYMYFNCEIRDAEVNRPTVCFTRKPGMIVAYENVGQWASGISPTNKDEYILAIFVLHSLNKMKNSPTERTLEEYIRRSEMADHTSWSDWSEGTYNPRIVAKIQANVNKIISKEFTTIDTAKKPKVNSSLGKLFGDMLLPPNGFGKRPGVSGGGNTAPAKGNKGLNFYVDKNQIVYKKNAMIVPAIFQTSPKARISHTGIDILVDSDAARITIPEWENKMGLEKPFCVVAFCVSISQLDGKKVNENIVVDHLDEAVSIGDLSFEPKFSREGTCYGLRVLSTESHTLKMRVDLSLEIFRRDVKPVFVFEKETRNG